MAKLDWERIDADDIQPQQVTYYPLSTKHVHWDRITLGALGLMAVAFWVWGQQRGDELRRSASQSYASSSRWDVRAEQLQPQTVSLAVLPLAAQQGVSRAGLSFWKPVPDQTVGATFTVRGMINDAPQNKQLWLITRREPLSGFWPKERVVPDADGVFEQQTWDYGVDGPLSICLLSSTDPDAARFDNWLAIGDRDDEWPALQPMTVGSAVLGCQEVRLDKHIND